MRCIATCISSYRVKLFTVVHVDRALIAWTQENKVFVDTDKKTTQCCTLDILSLIYYVGCGDRVYKRCRH